MAIWLNGAAAVQHISQLNASAKEANLGSGHLYASAEGWPIFFAPFGLCQVFAQLQVAQADATGFEEPDQRTAGFSSGFTWGSIHYFLILF